MSRFCARGRPTKRIPSPVCGGPHDFAGTFDRERVAQELDLDPAAHRAARPGVADEASERGKVIRDQRLTVEKNGVMDRDALPFPPASVQHLEVGGAEVPLDDEPDEHDEGEVPRRDEDVHRPRNGLRVVDGPARPLDDEVEQDEAAVPQEEVPAEPVGEVQRDPDDGRGEEPDGRQDSVSRDEPGEDPRERHPEKHPQQDDVREGRRDVQDDDEVVEQRSLEGRLYGTYHDTYHPVCGSAVVSSEVW